MNEITKPDYEIITYKGKQLRLYPNGYIRDEKGIVRGILPERQQELQAIRKAELEAGVEKGVILGTQSDSLEEAVMKITRARTLDAMTGKAREANDAARMIFDALGLRERKVEVQGQIQHKQSYELDHETIELLEKITQIRRDMPSPKIIEGIVSDVAKDTLKREGIE